MVDRLFDRSKRKDLGEGYEIVSFFVLHFGSIVWGAHKKTFEVFEGNLFARDKKHVYWASEKVDGADRNTFQPIAFNYGKDSNYVFRTCRILQGADPNTFQVLKTFYAKDDKRVYWQNEIIAGCHTDGFDILNTQIYLSCDKNNVFLEDKLIAGADPLSFSVIDDFYFKDKEHMFFRTRQIDEINRDELWINRCFVKADSFYKLCGLLKGQDDIGQYVRPEDFALDNDFVFFRGKRIGRRDWQVEEILTQKSFD